MKINQVLERVLLEDESEEELEYDQQKVQIGRMIAKVLIEKCQPWLKNNSLNPTEHTIFYRGLDTDEGFYTIRPIRKDRRPRDSLQITHDTVIQLIKEVAKRKGVPDPENVANRHNAAFVTKHAGTAMDYGKPYVFVPIGEYRTTYIEAVDDLMTDLNALGRAISSRLDIESTNGPGTGIVAKVLNDPKGKKMFMKYAGKELDKRVYFDSNDLSIMEREELLIKAENGLYFEHTFLGYVLLALEKEGYKQ